MSAHHTPGPWAVSPLYLEHGFCANDGSIVIMADSDDGTFPVAAAGPVASFKRGQGHKLIDAGRDANARLIASAPDLLAALKAWERAIPRVDEFASVSPDSLRGKALAAISKAEGK